MKVQCNLVYTLSWLKPTRKKIPCQRIVFVSNELVLYFKPKFLGNKQNNLQDKEQIMQ